MVINKNKYQVSQRKDEATVTIFKEGKLIRAIRAKENLKPTELLKILELYEEE